MEQADIDPSWLGPDEENYTIVEPEFRGVIFLRSLQSLTFKSKPKSLTFFIFTESNELSGKSIWKVEYGRFLLRGCRG